MARNRYEFHSEDGRITVTAVPTISGWTVTRWRKGEATPTVLADFLLEGLVEKHPDPVAREIACRRQAVAVARMVFSRELLARTTLDRRIAKKTVADRISQRLGLETLETRHGDALDFHDISVWQIRGALDIAFDAGMAAAGNLDGKENRMNDEHDMDPAAELLQTAALDTLTAVAQGKLDLNRYAVRELASRGMDPQGKWIGFDAAAAALPSWERHIAPGGPVEAPVTPSRRYQGPSR